MAFADWLVRDRIFLLPFRSLPGLKQRAPMREPAGNLLEQNVDHFRINH
jgi:hypothetical protein